MGRIPYRYQAILLTPDQRMRILSQLRQHRKDTERLRETILSFARAVANDLLVIQTEAKAMEDTFRDGLVPKPKPKPKDGEEPEVEE